MAKTEMMQKSKDVSVRQFAAAPTIVEPRRKVPEVTRPLPYSLSFNGLLNHRRLADLHLGGVAKRIHFTVVGAHPDFRS